MESLVAADLRRLLNAAARLAQITTPAHYRDQLVATHEAAFAG